MLITHFDFVFEPPLSFKKSQENDVKCEFSEYRVIMSY